MSVQITLAFIWLLAHYGSNWQRFISLCLTDDLNYKCGKHFELQLVTVYFFVNVQSLWGCSSDLIATPVTLFSSRGFIEWSVQLMTRHFILYWWKHFFVNPLTFFKHVAKIFLHFCPHRTWQLVTWTSVSLIISYINWCKHFNCSELYDFQDHTSR